MFQFNIWVKNLFLKSNYLNACFVFSVTPLKRYINIEHRYIDVDHRHIPQIYEKDEHHRYINGIHLHIRDVHQNVEIYYIGVHHRYLILYNLYVDAHHRYRDCDRCHRRIS